MIFILVIVIYSFIHHKFNTKLSSKSFDTTLQSLGPDLPIIGLGSTAHTVLTPKSANIWIILFVKTINFSGLRISLSIYSSQILFKFHQLLLNEQCSWTTNFANDLENSTYGLQILPKTPKYVNPALTRFTCLRKRKIS